MSKRKWQIVVGILILLVIILLGFQKGPGIYATVFPTQTSTETATITSSPSYTPSQTSSRPSQTHKPTLTNTPTPTRTPSPTLTPLPTNTLSPTPTLTPLLGRIKYNGLPLLSYPGHNSFRIIPNNLDKGEDIEVWYFCVEPSGNEDISDTYWLYIRYNDTFGWTFFNQGDWTTIYIDGFSTYTPQYLDNFSEKKLEICPVLGEIIPTPSLATPDVINTKTPTFPDHPTNLPSTPSLTPVIPETFSFTINESCNTLFDGGNFDGTSGVTKIQIDGYLDYQEYSDLIFLLLQIHGDHHYIVQDSNVQYKNQSWVGNVYLPEEFDGFRILAIITDNSLPNAVPISPDSDIFSDALSIDVLDCNVDETIIEKTSTPSPNITVIPHPTEVISVGNMSATYPQYMSPGSSGLVRLSISVPIPPEIIEAYVVESSPANVTRVDTPFLAIEDVEVGKNVTYVNTIKVAEKMSAELTSPRISVIPLKDSIQNVALDGSGVEAIWLWDISAPEILGKQNFTIRIWLDNDLSPTWVGDFEIEVIQLTPVPSPMNTMTPSPTNTATFTPIPEKSIPGKIADGLIDDAPTVIYSLLGALLLIVAVVIILHIGKRNAIHELEAQFKNSDDELEKINIQEQIDAIKHQSLWKQFFDWVKKRVMGDD